MVRDVLQRPLDAGGEQIKNVGSPSAPNDATRTDNATPPAPLGRKAAPGRSLLAAPADHVHANPTLMRIAASGTTTIAPGARVTLATFSRNEGELFPSGGFVFPKDSKEGLSWENKVKGAEDLTTFHERTDKPNELRFRAVNETDKPRTIEWASVALGLPVA